MFGVQKSYCTLLTAHYTLYTFHSTLNTKKVHYKYSMKSTYFLFYTVKYGKSIHPDIKPVHQNELSFQLYKHSIIIAHPNTHTSLRLPSLIEGALVCNSLKLTVMHSTPLQYNSLHFTVLYCASLYLAALYVIAVHHSVYVVQCTEQAKERAISVKRREKNKSFPLGIQKFAYRKPLNIMTCIDNSTNNKNKQNKYY